jgi:small subunit ribosomal protein S6
MNKYETVFIINPSVEEAGVKELTQKFSDLINSDGKVESVEEMGKRKLAYEIKKNVEGIYMLINLKIFLFFYLRIVKHLFIFCYLRF